MKHARIVHGTLQRISAPPEQIIRMSPIPVIIHIRPNKRLRSIFWPHVIKRGRIPHRFVRDLRHTDRVGTGTWTCFAEAAFGGTVHMRLVVGAIEILAVPARGEVVDSHDAGGAGFAGEAWSLTAPGHDRPQTGVSKAGLGFCAVERVRCGTAGCHAEAGFESGDMLVTVRIEVLLRIIYCHSAIDILRISALGTQLSIWVLWHPFVGTVLMSEVHHRRPIVREILSICTGCAASLLANVSFHRRIESISANNLMNVG